MYYNSLSLDVLQHSGILGMKWGIRRYQNEDGTLTEEGRRHYGYLEKRAEASTKAREDRRKYADAESERRTRERIEREKARAPIAVTKEQERSKRIISNNERAMQKLASDKDLKMQKMITDRDLNIEKQKTKQKKILGKYDLKIEKERGKQKLKEMMRTGGLVATGTAAAVGVAAIGYLIYSAKHSDENDESDVLIHAGVKFKSGRYPWGSGARPHQHDDPFTYSAYTDPNDPNKTYPWEWDYKALHDLSTQTGDSISSTNKILDNVGKMVDTSAPKRDYSRDLREMSDDEIKSFLNRVKLEQEYNKVMNDIHPVEKSSGKKLVEGILKYGGPALAITGSAVAVVSSLLDMKEKAQTKRFDAASNKAITDWFESVYPIRDTMTQDEKIQAWKNRQSLATIISSYNKSLSSLGYK